jgi:hypothetical protein
MKTATALTPARVADLTRSMKPQSGETVILVFVRTSEGEYLMCAPIPCSWMEAIAAMQDEHPALAVRAA